MNNKNFLKDKTAVLIGKSILLKYCIEIAKVQFKKISIISDDREIIKKYKNKFKILKYKSLSEQKFDFLFNVLSQKIINKKILKNIKFLPINFHDGPLPKYAGLYSSTWAIVNKEKKHGCCWHKIVPKIDGGEIFELAKFNINKNLTAYEVDLKGVFFGKSIFKKMLAKFSSKNLRGKKQNFNLRTYYGKKDFKKIPFNGFFNYKKSFQSNMRVFNSLNFSDKKDNNISKYKILINSAPYLVSKIEIINYNLDKFKLGYCKVLNKNCVIIKCTNYCSKITLQNFKDTKLKNGQQKIDKDKFFKFSEYGLNKVIKKNKKQFSNFKNESTVKNNKKILFEIFKVAKDSFKNLKKIDNISKIESLGLGRHLDWDSLGHMKFLNNLEKKFKIKINEKNITHFNTIKDTARYLKKIKY